MARGASRADTPGVRALGPSLSRSTAAVALALCLAVVTGGCATAAKHRIGYRSWDHFVFSLKTDWNQFVGWSPVATKDEAAKAEKQGWWGAEVPVWPGP